MAKTRELKISIVGDATQLNRSFAKAGKDVDKFGKKTETMGKKFSAGMKVAGAAAAGALAVGLKESVSAAIEAEKTQARLEAQLKASGTSYKTHAAAIEESIKATSRLSGLDDEDLTDSFTNIVRVTGDVNEALRLNALAADFARAKGMDVAKAGELVGKVAGGNIGVLSRYGITVKEGATAQEALAELQTRFAGQAEAYGKTTAGAADRAAVGMEGLQEVVGARLAPTLAKVANKFADLADWMTRNETTVKRVAIAAGIAAGAIGGLLIAAKVANAVMTLRNAVLLLNTAFLTNPVVLIVAALVTLGVALVTAYKKSEDFRRIVDGAFSFVKKVAVGALKLIVKGLDALLGGWSTMLSALGKVPTFGWATKAAEKIDRAREKLRGFADALDDVPRIKDIQINVRARISRNLRGLLDEENSISSRPPAGSGLTRQRGGPVPGSGRGDKVPAMLEPGEYVIQRKIVDRYGPMFFAALNEGEPPQMRTSGGIIRRANKLDRMRIPYLYGGGHGTRDGFNRGGMDCSASVSYALGISPRVSGALMNFGRPGPGSPNDTKIYANPGHVFAVFNGRGWGTSRENPGGGPGWLSYNHRPGFTIRHLEDGSAKGSRGGAGAVGDAQEIAESGKQRKRAREERAGSRLVNRIAAKFSGAIGAASRGATSLGGAIEDAGTAYAQTERAFGQTDENLGTATGRGQRLSEIGELAKLKAKTLANQKKRAGLLKRATDKRRALIRRLRKERDKARGAKRAKISERIKGYVDRQDDDLAELKALGFAIRDTELDIGDLAKEAGEVGATPDAEAPTATDKLGQALSDIDLQERAGLLTPEQAQAARIANLAAAQGGAFGALSQRELWDVMGQLREAQAAATEAQQQATQAANDVAQALRDVKASLDANTAFANQVSAVTSREAVRALASMISGELGPRVAARQAMPGGGSLSRL